MWLDKPEQWEALAARLRQAGEFGIDTETYGQPDKTSPQHRARVHCWSVGVLTEARSPRGFRRAIGRVLPVSALEAECFRALLADAAVAKWAHNAPHDRHSLENLGLTIRSMHDSLQWARVAVPGMRDYGLKEMERWALGYGDRPEFWDMMKYEGTEVRARRHREKGCICGAKPCRKPSKSVWLDGEVERHHVRVEWSVFTPEEKTVRCKLAVTDFVPGAELPPLVWLPPERPKKDYNGKPIIRPPGWWADRKPRDRLAEWWQYSALDAIRGIELVDWLRGLKPRQLVYPWAHQLGSMPST